MASATEAHEQLRAAGRCARAIASSPKLEDWCRQAPNGGAVGLDRAAGVEIKLFRDFGQAQDWLSKQPEKDQSRAAVYSFCQHLTLVK